MKKIIIFLMIVFFCNLTYAFSDINCTSCSTNHADYWWFDNGDTKLNNGTGANNQYLVDDGGWTSIGNCGTNKNCSYSDSCAKDGTLGLILDRGTLDRFIQLNNSDTSGFIGQIGYWAYYWETGVDGSDFQESQLRGSVIDGWSGYHGSTSTTKLSYGDTPTATDLPYVSKQWQWYLINFTATTIDWYINNTFVGSDAKDVTLGNLGLVFRTTGSSDAKMCIDGFRMTKNGTFGFPLITTVPPTLSNPICTSCNEFNFTYDSTPTINVTCIDAYASCQMVRLSNNSAYNFSNATTARNCTQGEGDTWVCTLPTSDKLNNTAKNTTIFFWANNTLGDYHKAFNLTINISYGTDIQAPTFYSVKNNTRDARVGTTFQFNATFLDNAELSYYTFSWNDSGSWVNESGILTGASASVSVSKTTTLTTGTIGFLWYVNDTSKNRNMSGIYTFNTVSETYLDLDGVNSSGTYEYETTVLLETANSYIDILDGRNNYNLSSPINYTINLLRIFLFSDGNITKNVATGSTASINIDNRTDLYNATVDINSTASGLVLNYSNKIIRFPGNIAGSNLTQDELIYLGVNYTDLNLSFITAGSKTIYINFSNQGKSRAGYLNFSVFGFDLDSGNDLNFTENFLNASYINTTANITVPHSVYDDFENIQTADRFIATSGCVGAGFSQGNPDDYYIAQSTNTECHVTVPLLYFDNLSFFNFTADYSYSHSCGTSCSGTHHYYIALTDGVNSVNIYSDLNYFSGSSGSGESFYEFIGNKTGNVWTVYRNKSLGGTGSIVSLNKPYYLKISTVSNSDPGITASTGWEIFNLKTSGIRMIKNNGMYEVNVTNGTFISSNFTKPNSISRVYVEVSAYKPENTTIKYYVSNNNGLNWETFVPFSFHTFSTTGNDLRVKFTLNTTEYTTSPSIDKYSIHVIPSSINDIVFDIGNDNIADLTINYTLNASNSPLNYTGNDTGFNNYALNCSGEYCLVPIYIVSQSGGILNIKNINITQNINPVMLNANYLDNYSQINLSASKPIGFSNLKFDFRGSKNISVIAHMGDYSTSINKTLYVKYSKFNITLPNMVDYWQIFPTKRNQSNIQPYGQNSTSGIFKVNSLAYDGNINVYAKYNESIDTCVTQMKFIGRNYSNNNLILYLPFNQNDTQDYSRGNNGLVLTNATWNSTAGKNNTGAYIFDGDKDYINISYSKVNITRKNFTITAWIKVNESFTGYRVIVGNRITGSRGWAFELGSRTNLRFSNDSGGSVNINNIPTISNNQWHFVAVSYNNLTRNVSLFYDGVYNLSETTENIGTTDELRIGGRLQVDQFFNGSIDELSIWNKTLSFDEILTTYQNNVQYYSNLTINNLTTSNQKISEKIADYDTNGDIFTYTQINCSQYSGAFLIPYFCFNSICDGCVLTQDWDSRCEWIE